jgi:DHA2 family multidrug resistance protein-like MFS transporter
MGIFGAMLMPSTLSLLRSIFRNRDQRGWRSRCGRPGSRPVRRSVPWSAAAARALRVGLRVPPRRARARATLILVPILVPESRDPKPGRFDPLSVVLSLATMVPIVYAIKEFAVHGVGHAAPFMMIATGLAFGVLFVRRQNRLETPMLDMALFRRWSFTGSVLVNPAQRDRARRLPLLRRPAPPAGPRSLADGCRPRARPRHRDDDRRGIGVVPIAKRVAPRIVVPARSASRSSATCWSRSAPSTGALPLLIVAFVSSASASARPRPCRTS